MAGLGIGSLRVVINKGGRRMVNLGWEGGVCLVHMRSQDRKRGLGTAVRPGHIRRLSLRFVEYW